MDAGTDSRIRRVYRRTTLVQRLTFVALAPATIIALLLVTVLTRHQLDALRDVGARSADAIALQTAAMMSDPLAGGRRREIAHIAASVVTLPNIDHVQVRAVDGEILADEQSNRPREATQTVMREVTATPSGQVVGAVMIEFSVAEALAAQREALRNALILLAVSLPLAGLIGWQSARWISAPLRRLANGVQRLARGDRGVTVTVTDTTEIGNLQRGFNAAAAALQNVQRGMERDIKRATDELARKNEALRSASVARSRFLAAASHDLRQPLYALTLFSSGLAVDERDPARLDRIAHIQECVEALDQLFSELLDLSLLETGAMQSDMRSIALDDVFAEVSRNFRMLAEQHGLRLVVRTTHLWVHGDRTMLARILNNLVSNALRYTLEGGVLVGARRHGDDVRVDVWDTGTGIAAEHRERVFDEFYRIDAQPGRDQDGPRRGLGLGLATVQRLGALIGTRVTLKSRPGKGSVFSFTLPAAVPQATTPGNLGPVPSLDISGLRVLVIDDEPAILSGIRFLLVSWGCEVAVARDREEALHVARSWNNPPNLVISDLHLGEGQSGVDVMAELSAVYGTNRYGAPPFARLLITGETRRDRLHRIVEEKIPLLYKPVGAEELREAIAMLSVPVRAAS